MFLRYFELRACTAKSLAKSKLLEVNVLKVLYQKRSIACKN